MGPRCLLGNIQYGRPHDFVGESYRLCLFLPFSDPESLGLRFSMRNSGFQNFLFPDSFKKAKDREEALLSDSTTKGGVASDLSPSTGKSC